MVSPVEANTQQADTVRLSAYDFFPEEWGDSGCPITLDNLHTHVEFLRRQYGYEFCFDSTGKYFLYALGEDGLGEIISPLNFIREVRPIEQVQEFVQRNFIIENGQRYLGGFCESLIRHREICSQIENIVHRAVTEVIAPLRGVEAPEEITVLKEIFLENTILMGRRVEDISANIRISEFNPLSITVDGDGKVANLSLNYVTGNPPENLNFCEVEEWEQQNRQSMDLTEINQIGLFSQGTKQDTEIELVLATLLLAATSEAGVFPKVGAVRKTRVLPENIVCKAIEPKVKKEIASYFDAINHRVPNPDARTYLTETEVTECISSVEERRYAQEALSSMSHLIAKEFLEALVSDPQSVSPEQVREMGKRITDRLCGYLAINGGNPGARGEKVTEIRERIQYNEDLRNLDRHKLKISNSLKLIDVEQSVLGDGDFVFQGYLKIPPKPFVFQIASPEFNAGNPVHYSFEYKLSEHGEAHLVIKKSCLDPRGNQSKWQEVESADERFLSLYSFFRLTGAGVDDEQFRQQSREFELIEFTEELPLGDKPVTVIIRNVNAGVRFSLIAEGDGQDTVVVSRPVLLEGKLRGERATHPMDYVDERHDNIDRLIYMCVNNKCRYSARYGQPFMEVPTEEVDIAAQPLDKRSIIRAAENVQTWREVVGLLSSIKLKAQLDLITTNLTTKLPEVEDTVQKLSQIQAETIAALWLSKADPSKFLGRVPRAYVSGVTYSPEGTLSIQVSAGQLVDNGKFGLGRKKRINYSLTISPDKIEVTGRNLDRLSEEFAGIRGIYEGIAYALLTQAADSDLHPNSLPSLGLDESVLAEVATACPDMCGENLCVETIYCVDSKGRISVGGCFIEYTDEKGESRFATLEEHNGYLSVREIGEDVEETKRPPTVEEYILFRKLKHSTYGTIKNCEINETRQNVAEARAEMRGQVESKLLKVAADPKKFLILYLLLAADDDNDAISLVEDYMGSDAGVGLETVLDKILTGGNAFINTRQNIFNQNNTIYAVVIPSHDGNTIFIGDVRAKDTQPWDSVEGMEYGLPGKFLSFQQEDDGIHYGPNYEHIQGGILTAIAGEQGSPDLLLGRRRAGESTEAEFSRGLLRGILEKGLQNYVDTKIKKYRAFTTVPDDELRNVVMSNLVYRLTGETVSVSPHRGVMYVKTGNQEEDIRHEVVSSPQQIFDRVIQALLSRLELRSPLESAESVIKIRE